MFYIALCDDSQQDLDTLRGHLAQLRREHLQYEDIALQNGYDLVALHRTGRRFHLIILDMMMEPIDGIETARLIRQYDPDVPILIVTATPEYAIDGYQVGASRYILKPVQRERFLTEVRRVLGQAEASGKRSFSFSSDSGVTKLPLEEITYLESDLRTITLHTVGGQRHRFTGKIGDLEQQLQGQDFVRVHKSFLVNLRHLRKMFKDTITLEGGDTVPLSKYKSKEIHQQLLAYMERNL